MTGYVQRGDFAMTMGRAKLEVFALARPTRTARAMFWRVSEWLAATLEMWCRVTGCGFESRALRLSATLCFKRT